MKAHAEWILKTAWLVYPLTVWLKVPSLWRIRLVLPAILIACLSIAGYLLFGAYNTSPASDTTAQTVQTIANPVAVLPTLSSVALFELTQPLQNSEIIERSGHFNLNFTTSWRSFADFSSQILQSNLAPLSYRLQWQPIGASASGPTKNEFNVQLQLAPGVYRGLEGEEIRWLPQASVENKSVPPAPLQCPAPPVPDFILQASWPARGYIQALVNGRSERIEINQLLGNSWQLRRIGSDSLEFSWHNADLTCRNEKTMTVAI